MSIYLHIDGEDESEQVASNYGWKGLREWVEGLDGVPALAAFLEQGKSEDPGTVFAELMDALNQVPPDDKDVLTTARGLKQQLKGAKKSVEVSHGLR